MTGVLICCIFLSVRLSRRLVNFAVPLTWDSIPISGYDPRHIMSAVHENPYDSAEIFKDTKCKRAMGIHWGTWVLTEEDVLEPPQLLK
jgi:N-acyl-phosphatidylethanolamine-hydrolysing phospholipase D